MMASSACFEPDSTPCEKHSECGSCQICDQGTCVADPTAPANCASSAALCHDDDGACPKNCSAANDDDCKACGDQCKSLALCDPGTSCAVAVGDFAACALDSDLSAHCWGGHSGEDRPPSDTFSHIAVGSSHVCGVKTDQSIRCWGSNSLDRSVVPAQVADWEFSRVSAGSGTCALREDGRVTCWGGLFPSSSRRPWPTENGFIQLDYYGLSHACALHRDGRIVCWGDDDDNALDPPDDGPYSSVAVGRGHSCGVRSGEVVCWGTGGIQTPPIIEPSGPVQQISIGEDHACGLLDNFTVECWGDISGLPPPGVFVQVSTSHSGACARRLDGRIECWGLSARQPPEEFQ